MEYALIITIFFKSIFVILVNIKSVEEMQDLKSKLFIGISMLITMILLSGCGESVEESIYNNLEETIDIESSEASEKISQLEKQDKELLDTVISFNDEELDKINDKADEAIKVNEDLKEALNEEEANFKEAKEKFEKSEKQINKLEEETEKELGLEMHEVMMNRYDTYDKLSDIYDKAIEEKINFYNLMKEEDVKEETILEQVEVVNKNNEEIMNLNNKMNEYTETYNGLKKEFYKEIDLNVEFKD